MLEKHIKELGQELKMEEFIQSPEPGSYELSFDGEVSLTISSASRGDYLFKGLIGSCPRQNVESFLVKTLEANLFGRGTRGAVIGLNSEGNLLTLSLEVDYNSSYQEFKDKLEDFVSMIVFWRQEASAHR